jgi:hypothetical protein
MANRSLFRGSLGVLQLEVTRNPSNSKHASFQFRILWPKLSSIRCSRQKFFRINSIN